MMHRTEAPRSATRRAGVAHVILTIAIGLTLCAPTLAAPAWPLRASANGRYLEDQNGIPFLIIGDAPWTMINTLTPTQMETYFADREAKGINAVTTMAISGFFGTTNYNGTAPFPNPSDWTVRNESYWTVLDTLLNTAKAHNILVLLAPAYLGDECSGPGWNSQMAAQSVTNMQNYGAFLGNRYRNQGNIIWVDGGDADCTSCGTCTKVAGVKDGIESVTAAYMRTSHSNADIEQSDANNYSWTTLRSLYGYTFNGTYISNWAKTEYDRTPTRPFFEIESTFENEHSPYSGPMYWAWQVFASALGGGTGGMFGNCPIWNFNRDTSNCNNSSPGSWSGTAGIGSPGSIQQGHVGQVLRSRAWWRFVPDYANAVVTGGRGSITSVSYVPASRTSDGETVMAYVPGGSSITVDMTKVTGTQAKAWWYNPVSGTATLIGSYGTTGSRSFTPPASNYVLVLDNAASSLAAPGSTIYPFGSSPSPPPPPGNLRAR